MKMIIFLLLASFFQLNGSGENPHYATCKDFKCIEAHKNHKGQVIGKLQKYTPNESGKGAGHMFWEYEILLSDGVRLPVVAIKDVELDLKSFLGKNVLIKCKFYHGIVIGGGEPNAQAATGWRIDAESINELK